MSAYSHAYYADLKLRHPDAAIHPIGATVISCRADGDRLGGGYLSQAAPTPVDGVPNPAISVPEGSRAWRIAGCHYADVYQLAQAVAAELRPRVRFLEGVAVTGLASDDGTVTVHGGTSERLVADSVVLAPGPWLSAPAWQDRLGPLGLRVKKIVALHIEQRPDSTDEVVVFDEDDAFLLPLIDRGHWLFSYSCQEWDVDPDALPEGLSSSDIGAARDCLRRYAPGMADACGSGRVFCDAYSPDREPLVRALDGAGRIVFAGAANGSGYRLAPAIGSEVADLLHHQGSEGVTGDHQYV
jgi:glycine/D-amino acid oxidase-like deaminating enzyme